MPLSKDCRHRCFNLTLLGALSARALMSSAPLLPTLTRNSPSLLLGNADTAAESGVATAETTPCAAASYISSAVDASTAVEIGSTVDAANAEYFPQIRRCHPPPPLHDGIKEEGWVFSLTLPLLRHNIQPTPPSMPPWPLWQLDGFISPLKILLLSPLFCCIPYFHFQ